MGEAGSQPKLEYLAGLYRHNNAAELVEIEECLLQDEAANRILTTIKKHLPELQSKASSALNHSALFKMQQLLIPQDPCTQHVM